jgi:tetratricopeptide (TPR) repeat protein
MKQAITRALPTWMLPAAGLGGIVALFYFGYAQELSIKVALGLAAAALASRVPGMLQIKSKTVSTSGAIAVFMVVMFADEVGQAIAPSAKIPGVSSHVRLSRDQMQYQSEIASAQFEIMNENYDGAIDILNHAKQLNPKDSLALHMIGTLYANNLKQYTAAAEVFEQGYRLGGPDKGRFAWNLALSHDAIGETEEAKKWIEVAYKESSRDEYPAQWNEIVYDRGLIHMVSWLREAGHVRTRNFEVAAQSFNAFLDHQPKSPHWADYNLACLHAKAAEDEQANQATMAKAVQYFDRFLHEVRAIIDPDKSKAARDIGRRVLSIDGEKGERRGPLEPVECPAIKKAWDSIAKGDWQTQVLPVFTAETQAAPLNKT